MRGEILAAALRTFSRLGYARTTVADITTEARVSRSAFYLYFSSKEAVFLEVAGYVRDEFLRAHDVPVHLGPDPVSLGRASWRAFLSAYEQYGDLFKVIEHQAIADPAIAEIWTEIWERPRRRVVGYVRKMTEAGLADPAASPDATAHAVVGLFTQFGRHLPRDKKGLEKMIDQLNAMYLRLLGIDAALYQRRRAQKQPVTRQKRNS